MTWRIPDGAIIGITGPSGSGKTTRIKQLCQRYKTFVMDADGHARMRLRTEINAGQCVVRRINDYERAIQTVVELRDDPGLADIEAICLDDMSLLSERIVRSQTALVEKVSPTKDERMAGSDLLRTVFLELCKFADPDEYKTPRHVIFMCLEARWRVSEPPVGQGGFTSKRMVTLGEDAEAVSAVLYGPLLPGKFAMEYGAWMTEHFRLVVNAETQERTFITTFDGQFGAKDSSGLLDPQEPADLLHVIDKIYGVAQAPPPMPQAKRRRKEG